MVEKYKWWRVKEKERKWERREYESRRAKEVSDSSSESENQEVAINKIMWDFPNVVPLTSSKRNSWKWKIGEVEALRNDKIKEIQVALQDALKPIFEDITQTIRKENQIFF